MTNIVMGYWLSLVFCLLAIACACLLMYVMVKYGEQQRAMKNNADPMWLQASRKTAFFVASSLMAFSAATTWTTGEISPYVVLVLLSSIVIILAFNAISQHRRTPPADRGGGIEDISWRSPTGSFGYYLAQEDIERLGVDISRLDRGQRLTHAMLDDIRNNQNIHPGPAFIPPDPVVIHTDKFRPRKAEEK
jgi:hypothetical protein